MLNTTINCFQRSCFMFRIAFVTSCYVVGISRFVFIALKKFWKSVSVNSLVQFAISHHHFKNICWLYQVDCICWLYQYLLIVSIFVDRINICWLCQYLLIVSISVDCINICWLYQYFWLYQYLLIVSIFVDCTFWIHFHSFDLELLFKKEFILQILRFRRCVKLKHL